MEDINSEYDQLDADILARETTSFINHDNPERTYKRQLLIGKVARIASLTAMAATNSLSILTVSAKTYRHTTN